MHQQHIINDRGGHIKALYSRQDWVLWASWIFANAFGAAVGWFLSAVFGFITLLIGFLGTGVCAGWAIGWAQRSVLERHGPPSARSSWGKHWEIATIWGGGFGFLVFIVIIYVPPILFLPIYRSTETLVVMKLLATLAGGAVVGVAQWRVLRRGVGAAVWWIPANSVGWGIGWYIAHSLIEPLISMLSAPDGTLATGFVLLLYIELNLATIVSSVITGSVLIWLLRTSSAEA